MRNVRHACSCMTFGGLVPGLSQKQAHSRFDDADRMRYEQRPGLLISDAHHGECVYHSVQRERETGLRHARHKQASLLVSLIDGETGAKETQELAGGDLIPLRRH